MRVLVTGGSGMIGRSVVDYLIHFHEVEVLDRKNLHRADIPFHKVDILNSGDLTRSLKGFDAVVHLAGIPHPLDSPAEEVFRVNALGTFNVLEACARHDIGKFVFMSSESTLGFAFSTVRQWPEFVPIDEEHVLRPQDPYGLSKLVCERLCAGFSRRTGMTTVALRAPWIWVPDEKEVQRYRQLITEYPSWYKNLWAFVHAADVAQAIEKAILYRGSPGEAEVCFISADENWTGQKSRMLLDRFYPETQTIKEEWPERGSFLSSAKAKRMLGFSPQFTATDIVQI